MTLTLRIALTIAIGWLGGQTLLADDSTADKQQAGKSSQATSGTKLRFNQLPAPVKKTMRSEAAGVNIENINKIDRQGQVCYQAAFDKGGVKGKLLVAEDGSLLQYQESAELALLQDAPPIAESDMQFNQLPQPVQNSVKQRTKAAQTGNIFKTNLQGKTAYHVAYEESGVRTDLLLNDNGEILYRQDQTALYAAPLLKKQTLSLSSTPESVQKAVREHAGAAPVSDIDKGEWKGVTVYKFMVEKNGTYRPLLISENGRIIPSRSADFSAAGSPASSEESKSSGEKPNGEQ